MRTIIAGSRCGCDQDTFNIVMMRCPWTITTVISGGARGVDRMGEEWAEKNGINVERFIPDWEKHGRAAGPIRNRQMAENADALIAFWDQKSKGTKNMIEEAQVRGLKIVQIVIQEK